MKKPRVDRRSVPDALRRVRPDRKGRVTLGKLARGISSFALRVDESGMITLEPFREVSARQAWRFPVPLTRGEISRALTEAVTGRAASRRTRHG